MNTIIGDQRKLMLKFACHISIFALSISVLFPLHVFHSVKCVSATGFQSLLMKYLPT